MTGRSMAPVEGHHLDRLAVLADLDAAEFERRHPEYAGRRLLAVLAQGAAQHYLDGKHGVKDLDVWNFYAELPAPGTRPFNHRFARVRRVADFGPSELGSGGYDPAAAPNRVARQRWARYNAMTGRKVDLMTRALTVPDPAVPFGTVHAALRRWLASGAERSSPWYLARRPVVLLWCRDLDDAPGRVCRGMVLWPGDQP